MRVVQLVAVLCILGLSGVTQAADTKFLLQFGFEGGGEKLLTTSGPDISAGGGLYLGGGFSIEPQGSSLAYVGTIGYLFDSVNFEQPSGNAEINTIPIELTLRTKLGGNGAHQIGGGITYHLDPDYDECFDGFGCDNYKFDSALGFNILYSYSFNQLFLTLKYTLMDYKIVGVSFDADSLGIYMGYKF